MNLSQLKDGQQACVVNLSHLPPETRKRLMVMGILPQTPLRLIRRAPLGDPLQVEARGVLLAIRESVAALIDVEVVV